MHNVFGEIRTTLSKTVQIGPCSRPTCEEVGTCHVKSRHPPDALLFRLIYIGALKLNCLLLYIIAGAEAEGAAFRIRERDSTASGARR